MIQGSLKTKQSGATISPVLSYHLRGGKPFPNSGSSSSVPQFVWNIYGTKGEIQVTAPTLGLNVTTDVKIRVYDAATDKDEEVKVDRDDFLDGLEMPGRNISRLYEQFADGGKYPDFEHATMRHALIDEMLSRWDSGKQSAEAQYTNSRL